MTTATRQTPTSRLRFGAAGTHITPPVGIYHRMWGAASHDKAAGDIAHCSPTPSLCCPARVMGGPAAPAHRFGGAGQG